MYLVYSILRYGVPQNDAVDIIADILFHTGKFFGPFSLIDVFRKILNGKLYSSSFWGWNESDGITYNFFYMIIGGGIFLAIVFINDFSVFKWLQYKLINPLLRSGKSMPHPNPTGDDDVQREIEKVKSKNKSEINENNLALNGLSKFYGRNLAVNQLHVSVEKAECFGILGGNFNI